MGEKILEAIEELQRITLLGTKNVLNIKEASIITNISVGRLYQLTCKRLIPHYKRSERSLYFDRAELEAWMKQNRVMTVDEAEAAADMRDLVG